MKLWRIAAVFVLVGGCAGSLRPLYNDFRIVDHHSAESDSVTIDIGLALKQAGWELDEGDAPNVISTEEETIVHWGLYRVAVSVDVAPVDGRFVRVFVHPYRIYAWGNRTKFGYLSRRVRNYVFDDLTEALEDHGIVPLAQTGARSISEDAD